MREEKEVFFNHVLDLAQRAGLFDYAPVKGTIIFRPYGFALWELIQKKLDEKIKSLDVENVYFPLFIPEKLLKKEKEHVQGFSPELAVVTIAGGKELKEKLVVRPTSETIIYETFSKWIHSWRDLPLKINQWVNVVRWEKRPRPFLRTTEFLWQEAHTCHETEKEAKEHISEVLKMYRDFYEKELSLAGVLGKKSELETFPGAKETFTFEVLLKDKKALQSCTAHNLGQNFSRVFNIKFKTREKKEEFVWQTCWGLSTRSIGALLMVHQDEKGFIFPPSISPFQILLIPIFTKDEKSNIILEKETKKIESFLKEKGFRVKSDLDREKSAGWKFNEWELKGVPLRIEIGKKEIEEKKLTIVKRDERKREILPFSSLEKVVKNKLEEIQKNLFSKSQALLKENTFEVFKKDDFEDFLIKKKGFVKAFWCEQKDCELKIKEKTKATTRCLPLENESQEEQEKCIFCQREAKRKWIFAYAY
jgi:prolyl-tRNA synthetase